VVDGLRGDHRFYQGGAAGRGDELAIPSGELVYAFVLKMLEVPSLQAPNGERKPKVPKREGSDGGRDVRENVIQVEIGATYRDDRAFLQVGAKTRDLTKVM
jgi:hypothetical protein